MILGMIKVQLVVIFSHMFFFRRNEPGAFTAELGEPRQAPPQHTGTLVVINDFPGADVTVGIADDADFLVGVLHRIVTHIERHVKAFLNALAGGGFAPDLDF